VPEKDGNGKPGSTAPKVDKPGVYVLQAGSYRNFADADRIRARLALQGVESKIQKVTVDNDTWHRVRIGPINKLADLEEIRRKLREAQIDALVIRTGD
jgi:cell division protein FtsN